MGTISPITVVSAPGINNHEFYFYPSGSFSGSALTVTITNTIGTISCPKDLDIPLPESCSEAKECEVNYKMGEVQCLLMPNGHYAYAISMEITNLFSASASLTFSAPYGEGYFLPNIITIVPGVSVHTLYFYPQNGYIGGTVLFMAEGHILNRICVDNEYYWLPPHCCDSCKTGLSEGTKIIEANGLLIAPNPATDTTTIFYNFVNDRAVKEIVLTDVLGRILQVWTPVEAKGFIEVNCSRFAQAHYLVIMKSDGNIVKTTKLIKD